MVPLAELPEASLRYPMLILGPTEVQVTKTHSSKTLIAQSICGLQKEIADEKNIMITLPSSYNPVLIINYKA